MVFGGGVQHVIGIQRLMTPTGIPTPLRRNTLPFSWTAPVEAEPDAAGKAIPEYSLGDGLFQLGMNWLIRFFEDDSSAKQKILYTSIIPTVDEGVLHHLEKLV